MEMAAGASRPNDPNAAMQDPDERTSVIVPNPRRRSNDDSDLPVWTATAAVEATKDPALWPESDPEPEPGPEPRHRLRTGTLVALALVAVASMGGFTGWLVGRGQSSSPIESVELSTDGETASTADLDAGDRRAPATSDERAGSGTATSTTLPSASTAGAGVTQTSLTAKPEPFVAPSTPDNPSGAAQYAVMTGGKAIMRGWYPTAAQAEAAVDDATTIMGSGNVVDETQIDGSAVIDPATFAVYFEDYILFEKNSATITPEFFELLNYPLFFMQQSPDATVTVVARTDATGSVEYNLDLAARRAEAVRDYWLANDGKAAQIILDPRGEEGAEEGAGDDQARQDRRVELVVSGFLATG